LRQVVLHSLSVSGKYCLGKLYARLKLAAYAVVRGNPDF
jgi:hypothetical protein